MKYAPHLYAKALVEVLSEKKHAGDESNATIAKNFIALVRRHGDESHLRKILEEASRFARGKSGVRKVTIESARALIPAQRTLFKSFITPGDVVEERIDPQLIAGVRIVVNDEMQFDGSLKHKLAQALGNAS